MNGKLWIEKLWTAAAAVTMIFALAAGTSPVAAASQSSASADDRYAPAIPAVAGDEKWSSQFMLGADGEVLAAVLAPNGDLFVGGLFQHIAGIDANYVAHW